MKRANKPKRRLRDFKLYLRKLIKRIDKDFLNSRDPILNKIHDRIGYDFIRWDERGYQVLICIYDKNIIKVHGINQTSREAYSLTAPEGCANPRLAWIYTKSSRFSELYDNINKLVENIISLERDKNKK